jgi:hypothetical protein
MKYYDVVKASCLIRLKELIAWKVSMGHTPLEISSVTYLRNKYNKRMAIY